MKKKKVSSPKNSISLKSISKVFSPKLSKQTHRLVYRREKLVIVRTLLRDSFENDELLTTSRREQEQSV